MKIEAFEQGTPPLALEDFFSGDVEAWGMFVDRFGGMRRQFKLDIKGTWNGGRLTLAEHFFYTDGESQRRMWHITKTSRASYEGRAEDVEGVAKGQIAGNAFNWTYDLNLRMFGRTVRVQVDDWMFLQHGGVLINRATMTKFGFELGTLEAFFRRKNADPVSASELSARFAA